MELKTKEFQEAAKIILVAANADKNTNSLQLKADGQALYLSVTDREYYCSIRFPLDTPEKFEAVVEADLFLNLIAGITTDTFKLEIDDKTVYVKFGKSNFTLPMIYENDKLMEIPIIKIANKTVEFTISNSILKSILNVNSKELQKESKSVSISEIQKYYYVDETGCFTFKTGACLNEFKLAKPIRMLLTEKVVKLFKLFNEDVYFTFGIDQLSDSQTQTKVTFETDNIYVAAILPSDDKILAQVLAYCNATKTLINAQYSTNLVIDVNTLNAAVSRLLLFAKNKIKDTNSKYMPVTVTFTNNEIILTDVMSNVEAVQFENDSYVDTKYSLIIDLSDLKLVLDSYKNEFITLNCGNSRSVLIRKDNINNLIPEGRLG